MDVGALVGVSGTAAAAVGGAGEVVAGAVVAGAAVAVAVAVGVGVGVPATGVAGDFLPPGELPTGFTPGCVALAGAASAITPGRVRVSSAAALTRPREALVRRTPHLLSFGLVRPH